MATGPTGSNQSILTPGPTGGTGSLRSSSGRTGGQSYYSYWFPSTTTTTTVGASTQTSTALPVAIAVVLLLSFFIIFSTGSLIAVGVLWVLILMIGFVLQVYGFIDANILAPVIGAPAVQPIGSATSSLTNVTLVGNEVFHISDNRFTYEDAPAVCAAYDARIATLEEIIDAYNHGAEWCGYGWSAGGMALYPTQKGTWDALQQEVDSSKRTACGRPGVNGGYFDPTSKFGVNCYGYKPEGNVKLPTPLPGSDPAAFAAAVDKWRGSLKSFSLDPYSRDTWSAAPVSQAAGSGQRFLSSLTTENFTEHATNAELSYQEAPYQTIANAAGGARAPYALRGGFGPTGAAGPAGPQGARGPEGVSTAAGPTGPRGPAGLDGTPGINGTPGAAGAAGATGAPGAPGTPGTADPVAIAQAANAAVEAALLRNPQSSAAAPAGPTQAELDRATAQALANQVVSAEQQEIDEARRWDEQRYLDSLGGGSGS